MSPMTSRMIPIVHRMPMFRTNPTMSSMTPRAITVALLFLREAFRPLNDDAR